VFDDDAAGETADLVCLKEEDGHIGLALIYRFLKRDGSYTPSLAEARSLFRFCLHDPAVPAGVKSVAVHLATPADKFTVHITQEKLLNERAHH
jgi:hypothetical protein